VVFASYLLLGIDQIAIQLEEPFGILPLEAISDTVIRNTEVITNAMTHLAAWQVLPATASRGSVVDSVH